MADYIHSENKIPTEAITTRAPLSEALIQALAGAVNFSLSNLMPVGSIVMSDLNEPTFQGETGTNWVLADGRAVLGSRYQELTGKTNVPDFRDVYPRGKGHGRGMNPDGDLPTGAFQGDTTGNHSHVIDPSGPGLVDNKGNGDHGYRIFEEDQGSEYGVKRYSRTGDQVGPENRPKTVITNFYIRIN